jgi:hypothetical protein
VNESGFSDSLWAEQADHTAVADAAPAAATVSDEHDDRASAERARAVKATNVRFAQHDLDREQDRDEAAPDEHAAGRSRTDGREDQVVLSVTITASPGAPIVIVAPREHDGADHGHQNEHGGHLERNA